MPTLLAALAVLFAQPGWTETFGDARNGEVLFAKCKGCHEIGLGAASRIGPHLNGIFGRTAGALEGFDYSRAFERAGDKGLEWHAEELSVFLQNPRQLVPGTRMSFRGFEDAADRADVIAYLREFSDSPADIPEADPTANATDHDIDPEILAIEGDREYGEYLSSECKTCHREDGADAGIPSIVHWPERDFVLAMHAFKSEARVHPVMNMIAGRLNNEEIAALASYFATAGN